MYLYWPLLRSSISGVGAATATHFVFNVSSASCQWILSVICAFSFYSKAVYLEVLVHDTPSCLGVPTDPDALCCEFVPHPGPVSPESRTSSFYVFAVVGDTCSNSVYSRPAATESSLIRKRLTVLSSEIVYSRPLAASESSFILTAAVISSKSSTLALYLRLPFFPPKYCAIHCPLSLICW